MLRWVQGCCAVSPKATGWSPDHDSASLIRLSLTTVLDAEAQAVHCDRPGGGGEVLAQHLAARRQDRSPVRPVVEHCHRRTMNPHTAESGRDVIVRGDRQLCAPSSSPSSKQTA